MKKITLSLLFIVLLLFVTFSCSKNKNNESQSSANLGQMNTYVKTVYRNNDFTTMRQKPYSIFNDYTTRVDRVGYGSNQLSSLRRNSEWLDLITNFKFDLTDIEIRYFDNTEVIIITVPIMTDSEKQWLCIYSLNSKFVFVIAKEKSLQNGNRYCAITGVDNIVHYDFEVSPDNRIGKIRIVSAIRLREPFEANADSGIKLFTVEPGYTCCSKPFNDCMNCFLDSCEKDWTCWLLCGFGPGVVICAATWATSCLTHSGCTS